MEPRGSKGKENERENVKVNLIKNIEDKAEKQGGREARERDMA